ncbi:unnamed protein product [Hydatigera taeniaeformis]|uniref:Non-specific serine/threonine protein kinase n=1 Tax=Hydatigena taeniaeformis TaxID=6205 RepID=A0A0R3WN41_HYDTA|nr:unnamed protein product [Hydatigera taeniaeformis]
MECAISPLRSALELIRRDGALDDKDILLRLPKYRLREMILAPIQVSLESSNSRLNYAAMAFVDSDNLYDEFEDPIKDTDLTYQLLDTISPCTIFSDTTQAFFLKAGKPNPVIMPKSVYAILCYESSCESVLSEPHLQILGVLKCLIEAIVPDNVPTQNTMIIPMYLQAIATTISLLPVSLIRHRVFLNILWQRVCPMLMWFLSNPKQEKNIISTSDLLLTIESEVDRQTHGTASSIAPPILWPEGLKIVYDIVIDLAFLVGPIFELRPMLESLFHKMLLYPPPAYRQHALRAVCGLLSTTEGLLCITGPLISVPMLSNSNGVKTLFKCGELQVSDLRIFDIILESVHACSMTKDQALVCTSAKCVSLISHSLSALIKCEGLCEALVQMIESQLKPIDECLIAYDHGQEVSNGSEILNTNLPRTLEVDRWAAHDYLLSLMKIIPNLLEARSIMEVDNLLLEFSSDYCKERRLNVADSVVCSVDFTDRVDDVHLLDIDSTLLNADAVYATTIGALALNYRLLQAGFYSNQYKAEVVVMSETEFLDSILGTGLMLYISETWLSQVYRGIRHQDLLSACGLDLILLRGSINKTNGADFRGACLIEMLVAYDGIDWTYDKAIGSDDSSSRYTGREGVDKALDAEKMRLRVGEALVSHILSAGWQRIVETLANTVAFVGIRVDKAPSGVSAFSFTSPRPSTACADRHLLCVGKATGVF